MKIHPNIRKKVIPPPKVDRIYLYKMRKTQVSSGRTIRFVRIINGYKDFTKYVLYRFRLVNGEYWNIFDKTYRKAVKEGRVKLISYENSSK